MSDKKLIKREIEESFLVKTGERDLAETAAFPLPERYGPTLMREMAAKLDEIKAIYDLGDKDLAVATFAKYATFLFDEKPGLPPVLFCRLSLARYKLPFSTSEEPTRTIYERLTREYKWAIDAPTQT